MSADEKPEIRRLPPVHRRPEQRPAPFNQRPALAGLAEAPDWRGYPPGHNEGEGVNADQPEAGGPGGDGRREPPKAGDLLIDRRAGRPGLVVRLLDEYVRLRPLRGGRPWIAPLPAVRHATDEERRTAVRRTCVLIWRGAAR